MSDAGRCVTVIGAGEVGETLARHFRALGAGGLVWDADAAMVFSDEAVDGVVLPASVRGHALARQALLADKHVFVAGPLAPTAAEGSALLALAEKKNRCLMAGHTIRRPPSFARLATLVASGGLGRIVHAYAHCLDLGGVPAGEDMFRTMAADAVAMLLTLAGEMPERVHATGGECLRAGTDDIAVVYLTFPSGLQAHVFASRLHPFRERRLVVAGERMMAVLEEGVGEAGTIRMYRHEIVWENNVPVSAAGKAEALVPTPAEADPMRDACMCFLDGINAVRPPLDDARAGLRVLKVLDGAQASLRGGWGNPSVASARHQDYFVHETSEVDAGAVIGPGTKIWHFSHVLSGSRVGAGVNIGQNVVIGPDVSVGDGCKIQNNVSVYKGVTLEDEVFCGPSMVFTNIFNPRANIPRMAELRRTLVRRGASLGANCTIVCGNTIGRHAFVGAGAVVTRDVPDHALVVGNPARRIGWICACGEKLSEDLVCATCGAVYEDGRCGLTPRA